MAAADSLSRGTKRILLGLSPVVGFALITVLRVFSRAHRPGVDESIPQVKTAHAVSSSCDYREYPWPDHHTGLPFLGDVFASHDAKWVYFIGINRGKCQKEYKTSDAFGAYDKEAHRFVCVFPDKVHVLSEFVHPQTSHNNGFLFRCSIPKQFQNLVIKPQKTTTLHVDLHSIEDMEQQKENGIRRYPSVEVTKTPKLNQLPICHPVDKVSVPKQYNLTAFVLVKSSYALDHNKWGRKKEISALPRMLDWISYHQSQGFDQFIIYDNDKEPHGPTEKLLAPLIKSGLVTYSWFPIGLCYKDFAPGKGHRMQYGQMAASLSALHRYGYASEFFAHMDLDEFFVPLKKNTTVVEIINQADPSVDALSWVPNRMAPCDGTIVDASESVLRKWKCLTGKHYADAKLIMRSERMLYFFIHYAMLTVNWTEPIKRKLDDEKEGFLAHYRQESDVDSWWRDDYSGKIGTNGYTNEVHFMDNFLQMQEASK
jgi:hypothetical protein